MPIYTFYCCKHDGSATTFEAHPLDSDQQVRGKAALIAGQHPTCAYVTVFDDDREVLTEHRESAGQTRELRQISIARTQVDPGSLSRVLRDSAAERNGVAIIATTVDGTIAYWGPAAVRLYGWRQDQAIGQSIMDLTPATQSKARAAEIMGQLQAGVPWTGEIVLRRRGGVPFTAFVGDLPIGVRGDDGVIVGASAPASQAKQVEAHLEDLERDLRQAFGP